MISGIRNIKTSIVIITLLAILSLPAAFCFAQDSTAIKKPSYENFGDKRFLAAIDYPEEAKEFCIRGVTVARFKVDTFGKISDISIYKGVSPVLDDHVRKILNKTSGYWRAGSIDGRPMNMWASMAFDHNISIDNSGGVIISSDNSALETFSFYSNNVLSMTYVCKECSVDELNLYNKGVKLYSKGKIDEALYQFETASRINYNDFHALFNCAVIYISRNENAKACQYLQKVQRTGGKDVSEMITKLCPAETN